MKHLTFFLCALVCALCFSSCNPQDDDIIINIQGSWIFDGIGLEGDDDIDIQKYYRFEITENHISIYGFNKDELTEEYSYTRKGNVITFTPAFLGKYQSVEVSETSGNGIMWKVSDKQWYTFRRK